jgi:hypothetical protein
MINVVAYVCFRVRDRVFIVTKSADDFVFMRFDCLRLNESNLVCRFIDSNLIWTSWIEQIEKRWDAFELIWIFCEIFWETISIWSITFDIDKVAMWSNLEIANVVEKWISRFEIVSKVIIWEISLNTKFFKLIWKSIKSIINSSIFLKNVSKINSFESSSFYSINTSSNIVSSIFRIWITFFTLIDKKCFKSKTHES